VIEKILVWLWLVLEIVSIIVHLYKVSKGEYVERESPTVNAVVSVIHTVIAFLIWIYLTPLV